MKQRTCALLFIFAVAAFALPQCATRRTVVPPMVPGPAKVVEPPKEVEGDSAVSTPSAPIGSIYRLDAAKKEVLVKTRRIFRMGERVYAEVGEEKAIMAATFPMLTSSKCALEAASRKYFGRLSKGMPVYAYVPDAKKMAGVWAGHVGPKGLSPQSMVKMNITYMKDGKLSGSVEYPDSGCEGTLTFKNMENDSVVFREKTAYSDRCADNGEISISLNSQGKLRWNRTWRGTGERTSGLLSKIQDASYGSQHFKSRSDFVSDFEYGQYVKSTIRVGMKVRAIVDYERVKSGYKGVYYGTNQFHPPCFVIWDRDLGTSVVWVPGAPENYRSWAYWVEWHHVQILE